MIVRITNSDGGYCFLDDCTETDHANGNSVNQIESAGIMEGNKVVLVREKGNESPPF